MSSEIMVEADALTVSGMVSGPFAKEAMVCHYTIPKDVWYRQEVYKPLFLVQITIIFFVTRLIYALLKPLRQSMITAQLMAGIIIGPTVLGRYIHSERLFPMGGKLVLQTAGNIGFMLHLFVLGVQMDPSLLKKAGGSAVLIGTMGFGMSYVLGGLTYFTMEHIMDLDYNIISSLPFIVTVNALSSFPVITSLLADLRILNSELGRLAAYTSMITDLCSWSSVLITTTLGVAVHNSKSMSLWSLVWVILFMITIIFVFRPFVVWLTKRNPQEAPMKETHFMVVIVVVLSSAIFSEVIGQHSAFGPFMLGIALPDGPPLGTNLVRKIDTIATGLLLPVYIAVGGLEVDLWSVAGGKSSAIIELIIIMGYIGKFTGTLFPALYCSVPFWEALTLALIMSCKGIIEVSTYVMWKDGKILDERSFALLLITMLIVSGIARPMVGFLYDPSRRYMARARRTIVQSRDKIQLRILVCVHQEYNVPVIINLLEASNSSKFSSVSIFVLHLMELTGSAAAILIPSDNQNKLGTSHHVTGSDHIVGAFRRFEQQHQGSSVLVQHFTAISPYASMHNDICSLALDKRTTIVIVPFHKQWAIDGKVESSVPSIRTVNRNVINKAPCSVGILIDRGNTSGNQSVLTSQSPYRIGLLFFGGIDDSEALAFARRMAEHPSVNLTVVRFILESHIYEKKKNTDSEMIQEFRANALMSGKNHYKEEIVRDGVETTQAIYSMQDDFDLVIVGKYHDPNSPLLLGLTTDWSECPELGVIGDMLASSESEFSILVVQQQPQGVGRSLSISRNRSLYSRVNNEFSYGEDFTPVFSTLEQGK